MNDETNRPAPTRPGSQWATGRRRELKSLPPWWTAAPKGFVKGARVAPRRDT